jgi:hypothetical protein
MKKNDMEEQAKINSDSLWTEREQQYWRMY